MNIFGNAPSKPLILGRLVSDVNILEGPIAMPQPKPNNARAARIY